MKTIETSTAIWATSLRGYKIQSLSIFCKCKMKPITKYTTTCPYYANKTLFSEYGKKGEFLPKTPYTNECNCCKGTGFVIVKLTNQEQRLNTYGTVERFRREKCDFCCGCGLNKKIEVTKEWGKSFMLFPFS